MQKLNGYAKEFISNLLVQKPFRELQSAKITYLFVRIVKKNRKSIDKTYSTLIIRVWATCKMFQ